MKLKQKLIEATKGKSEAEIVEFFWELFDVDHRDALKADIQRLEVEPKKTVKKLEHN